MSVIGLIAALLLCTSFAVLLLWVTREQSHLPRITADDYAELPTEFDERLADKPKRTLNADETPFDAGLRDLIRAGRSRDAIRIYREFTGATDDEAEREIVRLEWEEAHRANGSTSSGSTMRQ